MKFSEIDPYDSKQNMLSPRSIKTAYLGGGLAVGSAITYSALVMEQQYLEPADLDPALAVDIDAYQKQLVSQARSFSTVSRDFITVCARASKFAALMDAFSRGNQALICEASGDPAKRQEVVALLATLADEAGSTRLDLESFDDHLTTLEDALTRNNASYDAAITKAVAQLGEEARRAQAEIDRLTKAISDAIGDIVEGANETGGAVADLFIGILTQFTKSGASVPDVPKTPESPKTEAPKAGTPKVDPPKPGAPKAEAPGASVPKADPPGDKPKTDGSDANGGKPSAPKADAPKVTDKSEKETPSAAFVVKSVKAASTGVAKYSSAIESLEGYNSALAEAYLHLATLNPLVAVAKSAQAQKNLFASAVTRTRSSLKELSDEWSVLRTRLRDVAKAAASLDDPAEAQALASLAAAAAQKWSRVSEDVESIRGTLTGAAGLPGT